MQVKKQGENTLNYLKFKAKQPNTWFWTLRTTIDKPACIHPFQITKETTLICVLMIGTYAMN